jgi:hypothetical protein
MRCRYMYLFYVLSLRQPRPPHQVILERTTPRIDWSIPEEFIWPRFLYKQGTKISRVLKMSSPGNSLSHPSNSGTGGVLRLFCFVPKPPKTKLTRHLGVLNPTKRTLRQSMTIPLSRTRFGLRTGPGTLT